MVIVCCFTSIWRVVIHFCLLNPVWLFYFFTSSHSISFGCFVSLSLMFVETTKTQLLVFFNDLFLSLFTLYTCIPASGEKAKVQRKIKAKI